MQTDDSVPKKRERSAPRADRRIVRTKKALRQAMIELIEENGFDGFTVNDLCDRADINRGTFYNHYHDKDDLLKSFEDEFFADLDDFQGKMGMLDITDVLRVSVLRKPLPVLVGTFDYLREQKEFLHAILGPGGDASFAPRLRDSICTNLVHSILHERYRHSEDPFVGYYVAFFASAYLGVITRWIETGMKESSEDMARVSTRLLFIRPGESIKM